MVQQPDSWRGNVYHACESRLRVLLLFAAVKFDYPDRNHNGDGSGSGWVGIFGAREVIEPAAAQPTRG